MMQVVHDIPPGASLDFCTGRGTAQDFAQGIQDSDTAFADAIIARRSGDLVIGDVVDFQAAVRSGRKTSQH
jgi:hypothetical protein